MIIVKVKKGKDFFDLEQEIDEGRNLRPLIITRK